MASGKRKSRAELIAGLDMAGRIHSSAAVMYHGALAALQDLSATEAKAMDYLDRFGPLTPRELGRHSGLAPASVTGLIDRLERKGFARRLPNPEDGRSRLVELNRERIAPLAHLFDDSDTDATGHPSDIARGWARVARVHTICAGHHREADGDASLDTLFESLSWAVLTEDAEAAWRAAGVTHPGMAARYAYKRMSPEQAQPWIAANLDAIASSIIQVGSSIRNKEAKADFFADARKSLIDLANTGPKAEAAVGEVLRKMARLG